MSWSCRIFFPLARFVSETNRKLMKSMSKLETEQNWTFWGRNWKCIESKILWFDPALNRITLHILQDWYMHIGSLTQLITCCCLWHIGRRFWSDGCSSVNVNRRSTMDVICCSHIKSDYMIGYVTLARTNKHQYSIQWYHPTRNTLADKWGKWAIQGPFSFKRWQEKAMGKE